jgi:D-alanyl-lipoteichoic acid acyltransferase DltB (MBOAT superfamily)
VVARLEDYALFVSYFPLLLAGPIERTANLVPQLQAPRVVTRDHVASGAWLILWGLFKKVVIADNLTVWVDTVFAMPAWDNGLVCLLGLYAFAVQVYCDFSGYSDMARGVSKLMGIELMVNFHLPYGADNPAEFWRRWHISLSTWLRDFLFLPISYALSRRMTFERRFGIRVDTWIYTGAIVATMLLGGLWHGAAWTFVLWGLYQGLLLAAYRALPTRRRLAKRWHAVRVFVMFHLSCFGWLLFRADSVAQVGTFLTTLVTTGFRTDGAETMIVEVVGFSLLLVVLELWLHNADDPRTRPGFRWVSWIVIPLLIASLIVLEPPAGKSFIYFQF